MKSYLYSRISTLQQTKGFGIDRQVQTVTDFLKYATIDSRLGYQLDVEDFEVLESDLGKSAYKGNNWKPNSSLGRFYKDVVSGRITSGVLICENVDRLVRMSNYEASNKLSTLIDLLPVD
ncbi:recombinase family protein [Enterobacter hormaechei]|uniref:recombinase family protein n=1 Tax=Enterobacter hormaechei TaxID=158836 RepID=UPI0013D89916|nr:recombinase family protein [Enterobacter hormaechei]